MDEPIVSGEGQDKLQPPEPTPEPTLEPTPEPTPTPEPEPEPTPDDPDERIVGKLINKLQPWMGRRDKERDDKFDGKIQRTVEMVLQRFQPQQPPSYQPPVDEFEVAEKEKVWKYADEREQRREQEKANYNKAVLNGINDLVSNDDTFGDDEGLKKEIMETAYNVTLEPGITPQAQAKYILAEAKSRVFGKKIASSNAFTNKPKPKVPLGTLEPKGVPRKATVDVDPELRLQAKKMFGDLSDDKLLDIFKEIS